jgi:hypothetical protein
MARLIAGSLHCLSAFGSVVTAVHAGGYRLREDLVSIAFRRLVQSSPARLVFVPISAGEGSPLPFGVWFSRHEILAAWEKKQEADCLHCLSAFGSVVTRFPILRRSRLPASLHCLSAFGSVVTF